MPPNAKDVVVYLTKAFDLDNVNWALQMRIAKSLLSKYNFNEIKYALDYYKGKGEKVYSLGFLNYKMNMRDPVSLYNAESNMGESENSCDRNWTRIGQNSKAYNGTEYPLNLFEESDEVN